MQRQCCVDPSKDALLVFDQEHDVLEMVKQLKDLTDPGIQVRSQRFEDRFGQAGAFFLGGLVCHLEAESNVRMDRPASLFAKKNGRRPSAREDSAASRHAGDT